MSEDPLDEFIRRQAADYNAPPDVPRDLIWARIRAARRAAAAEASPAAGDAPTAAAAQNPWRRGARWLYWGAGLAAMLALGIGIGRLTWTAGPARGGSQAVAGRGAQPAAAGAAPGAPAAQPAGRQGPGAGVPSTPAPAGALATAGGENGAGTREAGVAARGQVYRLAANVTLSQAEAVLTAYRAEPPSRGVDPHLVSWARDVLSSTRLLIDSPAGADRRLRPLLEDLETVLVQIVQLPAAPSGAGERRIIDQAIQQRDVLPRLRTAIPSGPGAVGS